jgi:hypothetical protein
MKAGDVFKGDGGDDAPVPFSVPRAGGRWLLALTQGWWAEFTDPLTDEQRAIIDQTISGIIDGLNA